MKTPIDVAVHVVTESTDHYNWLLTIESAADLTDQLKSKMDSEFRQISNLWVSAKPVDRDQVLNIESSIMAAVELEQDDE